MWVGPACSMLLASTADLRNLAVGLPMRQYQVAYNLWTARVGAATFAELHSHVIIVFCLPHKGCSGMYHGINEPMNWMTIISPLFPYREINSTN